jgi:LysM repeat protein
MKITYIILFAILVTTQLSARTAIKGNSRDQLALMEQRLKNVEQQMEILLRSKNDIYMQLDNLNAELYNQKENIQKALTAATSSDVDKKIATAKADIIEEISTKVSKIIAANTKTSESGTYKSTGSQTGYEHVVQPGETISHIAEAYKVSTTAIIKANNIKDARTLQVGTKLFIPE